MEQNVNIRFGQFVIRKSSRCRLGKEFFLESLSFHFILNRCTFDVDESIFCLRISDLKILSKCDEDSINI